MPKKAEVKVTVNVKPVKLTQLTPGQAAAWKKFWQHLLAKVKDDLMGGNTNVQ